MATRKALVIGIDDYGGPPNSLTCCGKDAESIARVLQTQYGFDELHSLRDQDASIERVANELRWLTQGLKSDDRVVFYFSGHGFTKRKNGVAEESLVLRDGLFESERFLSSLAELPPGVFSAILDTCFSGANERFVVADASGVSPQVEVAQSKVWRPSAEEATRLEAPRGEQRITEFRRFARRPISSPAGIRAALGLPSGRATVPTHREAWTSGRSESSDEGLLAFEGLLLFACAENESASANTSRTDGHSAFTHALIHSIRESGPSASTAEVVSSTQHLLHALGFRQTPRLIEHAAHEDLRLRRFVTLEPLTTAETMRAMAQPRFWEGVLAAAAPQLLATRAAHQEVDHMTMHQPLTGSYPQAFGGYPQPFAPQYFVGDDTRTISALGPVLATIIPAIVPQIVNAVLAQQKSYSTGGQQFFGQSPFGSTQFGPSAFPYAGGQPNSWAGQDDVQRMLPVLAPILSSVIPAIVPQVVNSVLLQQRAHSNPWPTHNFAPDPWHAVSQSVNDALQRIGLQPQPTPFAGRL